MRQQTLNLSLARKPPPSSEGTEKYSFSSVINELDDFEKVTLPSPQKALPFISLAILIVNFLRQGLCLH